MLTRWPQLYLYGTAAELHRWERAYDLAAGAEAIFEKEVKAINRAAERARDDKPAMRRA